MIIDRQNIKAETDDWFVPLWVKVAVTFFVSSAGAIFFLALFSEQKTLLSLPTELIAVISLGFVAASIPVVIAFWSFPNSPFTLFLYWLIRFLRELICIFALLGIVYLITIRAPLLSFRGGIPLINLILLFAMGLFVQPVGWDGFPLPGMKREFTFIEHLTGKLNKIPAWILSLAVALLPILIVCAIIYWGLNASLADYRPYSPWYDETGYWVWIRSFSHAGLNVGYNAPNELIAPAAFNHYGEGSPLYVYLYGAVARLIGWSPQLPLLINFCILALAIFLFVHFTKLEPLQILFTGLIAVVTWPILLYLPMTTQETLNQAIGFILAAIFFRLLTRREQVTPLTGAALVLLIYLAALTRLSWGLFLIPVIFYALNGTVLRRAVLAVLLGSGLYLSATLITGYLVPPVNNSIFLTIENSFLQGPRILIEHVVGQFYFMFRSRQMNPNIAVIFQIIVIIGWSLIRLLGLRKSGLSAASILESRSMFDIYNMTTLAFAGLLFYLQEGFYRTFIPSMLVVFLLQAAKKDYRFLTTLIAVNIVFCYSYMTADSGFSEIIKADFRSELSQEASLKSEAAEWIVFDPANPNPWCNTLLIPLDYYDYRLTVIPPGIGISYILDEATIQTPLKSKYLLFDQETRESLSDRLNIQHMESSAIGDLYYNRDSGCNLNQ